MADPQNPLGGLDVMSLLGPFAHGQMVAQNWDALKQAGNDQMAGQAEAISQARQDQRDAAEQAILVRGIRQKATDDPTPEHITALLLADPQRWQANKAAFDAQDETHRNRMLESASSMYANLSNAFGDDGKVNQKNVDAAKAEVQKHIDADRRAEKDTSADEAFLQQIDQDPKVALANLSYRIGTWIGPGHFDEAFTEQRAQGKDKEPIVVQLGNGTVASVDRHTGKITATYQAEKQAPAGFRFGRNGALEAIPGGPADTEYIGRTAKARARERTEGPVTTSKVLGAIYAKKAAGQPLTPGEAEIYDDHKGARGLNLDLGGYGDEETPAPAAQARGGAAPAPAASKPTGKPQAKGGGAPAPPGLPEGGFVRQGGKRFQNRGGVMVEVK